MKFFESEKDYRKAARTIVQLILVAVAIYIILRAFFVFQTYVAYQENGVEEIQEDGFVALSYLGVDRNGTPSLISIESLEKELAVLRKNGFVTITQDDILEYYQNEKKLPEKALFLIFEDGRRDTAIFAQKGLEENNYIATIMTYAQKFEDNEQKFLTPKDLLSLKKQTFWEYGSNGYRLSYINVFDRYDHYLGELSSLEYNQIKPYLGRDYNQYLMDFIRDQNDIPLESAKQMSKRIQYDYQLMEEAYLNGVKEMPKLYALMHANTGRFGNNDKVSAVNEACIMNTFEMNFNREGYSFNTNESSIYDLTRMQVQPYWSTNHLLMRIADDAEMDLNFVDGDVQKKYDWEMIQGASEFVEDRIIITSVSEGYGRMKLKNSESYSDFVLETDLTGNKLGIQSIYLRSNDDCSDALTVTLDSNILSIIQIENYKKEILAQINLDELDGVVYASVEEDRKEALVEEYKTIAKYAPTVGNQYERAHNKMLEAEQIETKSVAEGAEAYIPEIQISEPGNRHLRIVLYANKISVYVDDKCAFENVNVEENEGSIFLESAFAGYGYSQRNIIDDVYDGVFEKMEITTIPINDESITLYSNKLKNTELVRIEIKRIWNVILNWFINTF